MAKGIVKIILAEFRRKIDVLEETQYKKQTPNAHEQANHVPDLLVLRQ